MDAGDGLRFQVEYFGDPAPAFVVRHGGRVHGYLNRCRHIAMELDWQPGRFFDAEGRHLLCSMHGAAYEASTGKCLGGACMGFPLIKLDIEERDGMVYFMGIQDG